MPYFEPLWSNLVAQFASVLGSLAVERLVERLTNYADQKSFGH